MRFAFFVFTTLTLLFLSNVNSQDIKDKVKDKAKDRAENMTDSAIDKGLDKVEDGIWGLFGNDDEEEDGKNKEAVEDDVETEADDNRNTSASNKKKSFKSYSKFDFVPGDKTVFFDDFADVAIGDFPVNWDTDASGEVVTVDGVDGKWFQMKGDYSYFTPEFKSFEFPDNFTLEFDMICPAAREFSIEMIRYEGAGFPEGYYPGVGGTYVGFDGSNFAKWNVYNNNDESVTRDGDATHSEIAESDVVHYSIWGQKSRLRVYVNEEKVIDVPKGIFTGIKYNKIRFGNYPMENIYLGNIRIAVGSPDTRSRLITEGKFVTHGITFDSGSDKIKPESYGVLKEIATVLQENPDVRVKIIGHTDSDGKDDFNLSLSKKRAAAVSKTLEDQFGLDSSRIETDGKGEKEPISQNTSPEGKANNRRVEFIKL